MAEVFYPVRIREWGTPRLYGWKAALKRALDVVGSLCLLLVFSLPMLWLAALVKLTSRGPALIRQERIGLGGVPFPMLKFRSMYDGAEESTGPTWAQESDPRRTPVGAFMRRFSLDELPQLINVWRGEMSLVGPRPERPHFMQRFVRQYPDYALRHRVKPGVTGWAQVKGFRGNTSVEIRLRHDLYYIENWSLRFDLWILLLTPPAALRPKNAY